MKIASVVFLWIVVIGFAVSFNTNKTWANSGEVYGLGSRASALGNTMMGGANDGFATYYNPAANSANEGFRLSYGLTFYHPEFKKIDNVVVSNLAVSASGVQYGSVDTDYLDYFNQFLGASLNLGEKLKYLTFGLAGVLPVTRMLYLDTGDAFKPEYFNYRSRTQRPQIFASLSARPIPKLYVAAGLSVATNIAAKADFVFSTATGSVSYGRFSSTIKPSSSFYFGMYTDPKPLQAGITFRLPTKYKVSIDTNADARVLGQGVVLPVSATSLTTVYYDPAEVDLGAGYQAPFGTWFTAEVDWLNYSAFESPTLGFQAGGNVSGGTLTPSISNVPKMRDIWIPKVGIEHAFGPVTPRVGYFFRMSPVKDNSGSGNLVDPTQHVFTAGAGVDLQKANLTKGELSVDVHAQYHWLVEDTVAKTPGNEVGSATEAKIGSPSYKIGGAIYGGGVTLSMKF